MNKVYKNIPGFEKLYAASKDGDILSIRNDKVLKQRKSKRLV